MSPRCVSLDNGVRLELLTRRGCYAGLGRVWCDGVPLRRGRRPMDVVVRTPNGVQLGGFRIVREDTSPAGVRLTLSMEAQAGGPMDYMLHTVRNRLNTADWTAGPEPQPDASLVLDIRPVTRNIGGRVYQGFAYRYEYRNPAHPVYKILDRGTWEIGGRAVGNEIWMRNCFVPALVPVQSREQFYSTEWYLPSCANPNIFQFLPLQTELQGFTFTAARRGVLLTWATAVAHVRTLIEKPRGADEIVHWHEHAGDLAGVFRTAPMEVLFCPGRLDRAGRANAWEAVRELVFAQLHRELGMAQERIDVYGQIEEWTRPDLEHYRTQGLPKLLDAGCRIVYVANHFENNMNTWGVSNMCCTVDYQVAETVGKEKLAAFCADARAGGARVEMWGNTSVSALTWIFSQRNAGGERIRFLPKEGSIMEAFEQARDPWVRNPSNAIEADHYTPVFCVMNLRDPVVREYWLRRWREAHDDVGLEGIFLDSSFNLSSDKFHFVQNTETEARGGATADQTHLLGHYRPPREPQGAILSLYRAHLDLVAEMQRFGIRYCCEDLGVFGIHRHGPGIDKRLDCLHLWAECICSFDVPAIASAGAEPEAVFFQGLACRMMYSLFFDMKRNCLSWNYYGVRGDDDLPTAAQLALLRAFSAVNPWMHGREILPREAGVVYRHAGQTVLWAFRDLTWPVPVGATVVDVLAGSRSRPARLRARRHRIYRIG